MDYVEKYTTINEETDKNYSIDVYNDTLKISLGDGTIIHFTQYSDNLEVILDHSTLQVLMSENRFPRLQKFYYDLSRSFQLVEMFDDAIISVLDDFDEDLED